MPYTPRARLTIPALIVAHVLSVCSILVFVGNRSDGHLIARRQTESFAGPQLMKIRHKASSVLDDVSHLSYSGYVASQANNWTADHTLQCCGRLIEAQPTQFYRSHVPFLVSPSVFEVLSTHIGPFRRRKGSLRLERS